MNRNSEPLNFRELDDDALYQYLFRRDVYAQIRTEPKAPKSELAEEIRRRTNANPFWLVLAVGPAFG